jgi:polar amino acid transport system permease protein/polar amino acid transport system substrate-binding protein
VEALNAWAASFWQQFQSNLIQGDRYKLLLQGLGVTVQIALAAAVLGVILGSLLALMRLSKVDFVRGVARVYVDVIRGTPVMVQLLIMYYIILVTYTGPKVLVAILSFGLNSAAYVSEMVRGGILSVDKGQTEAGRSLGLSGSSTMLLIIMPQAIKNTLPSLFNEFIMLLKETSIVGYIALMDLTKAGDFIRSRTFSAFFPLLSVAAIYLVLVLGLSAIFGRIERRVRQGDHR